MTCTYIAYVENVNHFNDIPEHNKIAIIIDRYYTHWFVVVQTKRSPGVHVITNIMLRLQYAYQYDMQKTGQAIPDSCAWNIPFLFWCHYVHQLHHIFVLRQLNVHHKVKVACATVYRQYYCLWNGQSRFPDGCIADRSQIGLHLNSVSCLYNSHWCTAAKQPSSGRNIWVC